MVAKSVHIARRYVEVTAQGGALEKCFGLISPSLLQPVNRSIWTRTDAEITVAIAVTEARVSKTLGVGIVGASAQRGWAKDSHVPAVQGLEGSGAGCERPATRRRREPQRRRLLPKPVTPGGLGLIQDPAVDIVTIAVKVPDHRELVLAAGAAGKHVYCEWPLGKNLAEAEEMATAASNVKAHTAIGL